MADLIDRGKLIDHITETYSDWCVKPVRPIFDFISGMPSVDAIEVVRCKDCAWYDENDELCLREGMCMDGEDYCSYGERNDGRLNQ